MIDREAHRLYHELEERRRRAGITMEVYLGVLEKTEEEVEEELRPQAERVIKRRLVLEADRRGRGPRGHRRRDRRASSSATPRRSAATTCSSSPICAKSGRQEALRDEMLVAKTVDFVADSAVRGADDRGRRGRRRGVRRDCRGPDEADVERRTDGS